MSDPVLHVGATAMCPHAGQVSLVASSPRVKVSSNPVVVQSDTTMVAGCPFQVPAGPTTKPQPCVTVQWLRGATRVKASGKAVLLKSSTGLAKSAEGIPQGPPNVVVTQPRVKAT